MSSTLHASLPPAKRSNHNGLFDVATTEEQSRQNAEKQNGGTGFLRLPGEIRNQIYEYCREELRVHLDPEPGYRGLPDSAQRRKFFSLTQVCRKIRGEFRPLWLEQTKMWVLLQDFVSFKVDFLNPVPATIKIRINVQDVHRPRNTLVDIVPIINFKKAYPHFNIKFASRQDDPGLQKVRRDLNMLFINIDEHRHEWKQFLANAVVKVMIDPQHSGRPAAIMVLRPEFMPDWRKKIGFVNWYHNEVFAWMNKVGYPLGASPFVTSSLIVGLDLEGNGVDANHTQADRMMEEMEIEGNSLDANGEEWSALPGLD